MRNGATAIFEQLAERVELSKAVMNRRLGPLYNWVASESQLFYSYHQLVKQGHRRPNEDTYDKQRIAAESAISPYFFDQLNIATLSLDGRGLTYYGPYTITLKEKTIAHRTTVFTENPFHFLARHNVVAGSEPPVGFRSGWEDRARVVMAKLGAQLGGSETEDDFAKRLMNGDLGSDKSDFIELHIFGSMHASSIASVRGPDPADPEDIPIWRTVRRKLEALGAQVEIE
ncbi:hypothetical protein [Candidatus Viadribacter manganicus]|uniref:Uncharacterized protein n=1 Tax=Candidatus Viadribacter manganicus TaxID=1759059 RepID=A0A1B1AGH3_9PROT|nr:hypothetical protein [Candidatus Viadribacter manganicus]ANP45659.1 hypothetical protein ATE48_06855 [Candidatus Viadribacter manganicus]